MVRRRGRARRSRGFRFFRRGRSRRSGEGGVMGALVGAAIYGAIRAKAAAFVTPYTNKLPLGNISDEVGLGVLAWAGDKFVGRRFPMARPLFKGAMIVEGARIGEAIATNSVGMGGGASGSSQNMLG